jgi:hypothetical protein
MKGWWLSTATRCCSQRPAKENDVSKNPQPYIKRPCTNTAQKHLREPSFRLFRCRPYIPHDHGRPSRDTIGCSNELWPGRRRFFFLPHGHPARAVAVGGGAVCYVHRCGSSVVHGPKPLMVQQIVKHRRVNPSHHQGQSHGVAYPHVPPRFPHVAFLCRALGK